MLTRTGRALRLACPNCGAGGLFRRWTSMVVACPGCEHRFERHEGYWLGAIALNTGITMVVFVGSLVLLLAATWPDPPWGLLTGVLVGLMVVTPIALYPLSKTLWVALDLTMHPAEDR